MLAAVFIMSGCSCWCGGDGGGVKDVGMPEYGQLEGLKASALAGEGHAALQLSLWYMKFPDGVNAGEYWDRIAAENGSPVGQCNLGSRMLKEASDVGTAARARYWLGLSARQGFEPASGLLAKAGAGNRFDNGKDR